MGSPLLAAIPGLTWLLTVTFVNLSKDERKLVGQESFAKQKWECVDDWVCRGWHTTFCWCWKSTSKSIGKQAVRCDAIKKETNGDVKMELDDFPFLYEDQRWCFVGEVGSCGGLRVGW